MFWKNKEWLAIQDLESIMMITSVRINQTVLGIRTFKRSHVLACSCGLGPWVCSGGPLSSNMFRCFWLRSYSDSPWFRPCSSNSRPQSSWIYQISSFQWLLLCQNCFQNKEKQKKKIMFPNCCFSIVFVFKNCFLKTTAKCFTSVLEKCFMFCKTKNYFKNS